MDNALKFKVASALLQKYCLYRRKWVRMDDPQIMDYSVNTIQKRFTDGDVMNHLDGKYSVCVFSGEHGTSFISIDIDLGEPEVVNKVIDTMADMGIPRDLIYVSYSGRKGYHVDIFFRNFIYNSVAEKFYWALIERSGLNPRKVEFRPTHRQAIKLPLGIHQATRNRCWFVDRETLEPIEDFEYIFTIEQIPAEYMNDLVGNIVNEHMRSILNEIKGYSHPPKIATSVDDIVVREPGTRHNLQAKVAARARMDGNEYDDIVRIQMEWYNEQDKSKIASCEEEVRADAESLAAWAVKSVEIKQHTVSSATRSIEITKYDIPYILNAPSRSVRMACFLLILFNKIYKETKMSYSTIAKYIGLTEKTANRAIKWLVDNKYIGKKGTFCRRNKFVSLHGSNVYTFPGEKSFRAPNKKHLLADQVELCGDVLGNIGDNYYRALAAICKPVYLAQFLTKPELEECAKHA